MLRTEYTALYAFFVFPISKFCTTYDLFIGQNTKNIFRSVKSLPRWRLFMNKTKATPEGVAKLFICEW